MNGINTSDLESDEILGCEIADAALEIAANATKFATGAATLAFCSGLDTCPGAAS